MADFKTLLRDERFSRFEKLSAPQLKKLHRAFPHLPADYLDFVETVGFGSLSGDRAYMFYGGLIAPADVYDPATASCIADVLLFGDNFAGDNNGFDPAREWCVVRIDQAGERTMAARIAATFTSFLTRLLKPTR